VQKLNRELFCLSGNSFKLKYVLTSSAKQILFNGYYTVESFFFIRYRIYFLVIIKFIINFYSKSGLLTTYTTLKYTSDKYSKLSKFGFLVSRFIRLTPQLAIFILLTSLLPLMGSGPVWNQRIQPIANKCYSNWWQNIIYLQNIIDAKNMVSF
jgi:hypothetical protein